MRDGIIRARRLRREMTLPEVMLWQVLHERPDGVKFRRQHPLDGYVLDFFCREAGLAIEIDGEVHSHGRRPERDAIRDERLRSIGIATLRIPARDVMGNLDAVVRHIVAISEARIPLHHPALPGGPPPREKPGGD